MKYNEELIQDGILSKTADLKTKTKTRGQQDGKIANILTIFVVLKQWKMWLTRVTASVQSDQMKARNMPVVNQLITVHCWNESIADTDTAETLSEWRHFEHLLWCRPAKCYGSQQ